MECYHINAKATKPKYAMIGRGRYGCTIDELIVMMMMGKYIRMIAAIV